MPQYLPSPTQLLHLTNTTHLVLYVSFFNLSSKEERETKHTMVIYGVVRQIHMTFVLILAVLPLEGGKISKPKACPLCPPLAQTNPSSAPSCSFCFGSSIGTKDSLLTKCSQYLKAFLPTPLERNEFHTTPKTSLAAFHYPQNIS